MSTDTSLISSLKDCPFFLLLFLCRTHLYFSHICHFFRALHRSITEFFGQLVDFPDDLRPWSKCIHAHDASCIYAYAKPSFRDEEVNWDLVRVLKDGETVSVDGTHLGHNLPDGSGNRYCINLVSYLYTLGISLYLCLRLASLLLLR